MFKKRLLGLVILVLMAIGVFGCSSEKANVSNDSKEQKAKIKIANIYGADTYESKAMVKFKEIVEKKTDNIVVEVYTNAQLGGEEAITDSVRQGSVEIGVVGTMMAQYVPLVSVAEYPFLYKDWDEAKAVMDNKEFIEMSTKDIDKQGIEFLGYGPVAFRVISSNFPIKSMEDFKGMRLRVPNIPMYIKMAENLGANAIAMSISELFTGLEQKVVDGQENPYNVIIANKFYEVQPYILDSRHNFTAHGWYANKKFMDGLSEDNKKIVRESISEAIEYCWDISKAGEKDEMEYLKNNGVEITIPDETFRRQMVESQDSFKEWYCNEYKGSEEVLEKAKSIIESL